MNRVTESDEITPDQMAWLQEQAAERRGKWERHGMPDDELLKRTAEAMDKAHKAPKSIPGEMGEIIDGNSCTGASDAWSRFSNEWMALAAEVDRRGLAQPNARGVEASAGRND